MQFKDTDKIMSETKTFLTGKNHVSFSEINLWRECTFRHKLRYIDKILLDRPSEYLDFGKAIHAACENFLKTRVMNVDIALEIITEEWEKKGFYDRLKWNMIAINILESVPAFFDKTFLNWEYYSAEEMLYENLEKHDNLSFKGYIDGVIKADDKRGNTKWWIIDYKTCSWGWPRQKKQSPAVASQLVYYKHFWAKKRNIDLKDIKCAFILMKRTGKKGKCCELVHISSGEERSGKALKVIDNMIHSVNKNIFIKNRDSCRWCEYKDTEHCP